MSTPGQRGFTVLELLLVVFVVGLVVPVVLTMVIQMSRGTNRINTEMVIQNEVDTASGWFSRDLSQARTTDVADDPDISVNHMRVGWDDKTGWAVPGQEAHYAEYTLSGTNLMRDYDGIPTTVARYVADIQFSRDGDFISVVITSSLSDQGHTLSYFVTPRADAGIVVE